MATAAGFLVLLLSPIPMVRGFGLLLVAGVAIAFALALTAGLTTLSLVPEGAQAAAPPGFAALIAAQGRRGGARVGASDGPGAGDVGRRPGPGADRRHGRRRRWAGALGTQTEVISDIRELVPRNLPELQNVDALQDVTGVSGEVESRSTPTISPTRRWSPG